MKAYSFRTRLEVDIAAVYALSDKYGDVSWSVEFCKSAFVAKYCVIVACFKGEVIGFIMANTYSPTAMIYNLVVAKEHCNQGVASRLLHMCCQQASDNGCDMLQLECRENNMFAQRLYAKHEFNKAAEIANFYKCPPEAAVVLQKKL